MLSMTHQYFFFFILYLIKFQRKANMPICVWPDMYFFKLWQRRTIEDWREWRCSCLGEMVMRTTGSICFVPAQGPGTSQQSDHTICKYGKYRLNVLICSLSNELWFSIIILFYNNNSILTSVLRAWNFLCGKIFYSRSLFDLVSYIFPKLYLS